MDSYVKVLRSYDYNHFEFCIPLDEKASVEERNETRKDAERLANEAVRQYKKAKEMEVCRVEAYEKNRFRVERIKSKPEGERTVNELATLKAFGDREWEENYNYDYEDDEI